MAASQQASGIAVAGGGRMAWGAAATSIRLPAWAPLTLLLLASVATRVGGLQRPLVGQFATKNVVYAMIARNWATGEAPWWHPSLDCLADGQPAWHLLEIPVSAYLSGACWRLFGGSLDMWGRATSVAFSTAGVWLMFHLAARWHSRAAAWGAAVTLAITPVSIIYGQAMMLEASLVCFTLATLLGCDLWLSRGSPTRRYAGLGLATLALAMLLATKVYMLVILLPMAVMCVRWWRANQGRNREATRDVVALAAAAVLAIAPTASWQWHVREVTRHDSPVAKRVFYSVWDSADAHRFPSPLFADAEFYRQLLDDLAGPVLGPVGLSLALLAFADRAWRRHWAWLAAMGVVILALPLKFHVMQYYHMVWLPLLAMLVGLGWSVLNRAIRPSRWFVAAVLAVAMCVSSRYAFRAAFITPPEDRAVVAAGRAVASISAPDEKVVAIHGSTLDLLYYSARRGWAPPIDDPRLGERLDEFRAAGATWLVVADLSRIERSETASRALAQYEVVAEGDDYRVYRLTDSGMTVGATTSGDHYGTTCQVETPL